MLGVLRQARRKNEGNYLGRKHLILTERRRIFSRKKLRGKRAERNAARTKHKATRARSQLNELTFGTFSVRTAAVNGVNGIGNIDTVLRPCAAEGGNVIGLQKTKRDGTSEILASGYFSGDFSRVKDKIGHHGVQLDKEGDY